MKKLLILFCCLSMIVNYTQSQEWIRVFGPPNTGKAFSVIESYDHGYLIGGHYRHNNYLWYYGWLLKTDINGELLWDIKLGNDIGSYASFIKGIDNTPDGGLIICGSTYLFDNPDGFIMKLDACGQKEWCNIYKSPGFMDYSIKVHHLPEGGYIMNYAYWGYDLLNKRIWLFRLDEEGNTLWQNLYGTDTSYWDEHAFDMIITPDSGYLLTGENWIEIDTMPGYYYSHPFFIKVNKEGDEQWEHTYWPDSGFSRGVAKASVCDNSGNIYSAGYRGNLDEPCIIKIDENGQPIMDKILMDSIYYGKASTINFLSDSTLVIGGYHGHANGLGTTKIWKVDTIGNVLIEKDSLLINVSSPKGSDVTFDDKIVFVVTTPYTNPDNFDIVMYKLNSNLEYDSIYNQPFTYDYLCPDTIVSYTIEMDCNIIVNLEEQLKTEKPRLVIRPNPARDVANITLPEYYKTESTVNGIISTKIRYLSQTETQLLVYDIMGRFNVSGWEKGIYFIRLLSEGLEISSGKIVVQ